MSSKNAYLIHDLTNDFVKTIHIGHQTANRFNRETIQTESGLKPMYYAKSIWEMSDDEKLRWIIKTPGIVRMMPDSKLTEEMIDLHNLIWVL